MIVRILFPDRSIEWREAETIFQREDGSIRVDWAWGAGSVELPRKDEDWAELRIHLTYAHPKKPFEVIRATRPT